MNWFGLFCIGASAAFALILLAAFIVIPHYVFRTEPKLRDDYSLTLSPAGVHFRTAHIDSQLQWSMYSRALVDTYSYLLYYGSRSFSLIPRRVFESGEQVAAFEQLLTQHVLNIVRRP